MKKVDVIVPYYVPPFLGGTETVLRDWNEWFGNDNGMTKVRFIVPFKQRGSYIFKSKKSNHVVAPSFFTKPSFVKALGILFLVAHLFLTKTDEIVVLSPKYIKLAKLVQRVAHKKYRVISWMHFSLNSMFTDQTSAFLQADAHLAISTGIERQLISMGVNERKIFPIYNPVSKKNRIIETATQPVFIFVGRLESLNQKNVTELIKGFALVHKSNADAELRIIGDGADRHVLEDLVHSLGLENHVEFLGWKRSPFEGLKQATALVLTSTFEGLPMVLLESISFGLPVVSSDIQTGPADIVNPENGLLYQLGNIEMLARQMLNVYDEQLDRLAVQNSINQFYAQQYFKNVDLILEDL